MKSIASLTATIAELFGVQIPEEIETGIEELTALKQKKLNNSSIDRCLIFCPDALGVHIWNQCLNEFDTLNRLLELRIPLTAYFPPKTPVCFASMFSGLAPFQHGIMKYERPVLRCNTLFDMLIAHNKKIAVIAVEGSSIDLIFRERNMDYYSEFSDSAVESRVKHVLCENNHHLVIVYQQEYDDCLHRTTPFSSECLQAVINHQNSFQRILKTAQNCWHEQNHAVVFAPDHGAHLNSDTGFGDHGLNISEDMDIFHWYGIFGKAGLEQGNKKS